MKIDGLRRVCFHRMGRRPDKLTQHWIDSPFTTSEFTPQQFVAADPEHPSRWHCAGPPRKNRLHSTRLLLRHDRSLDGEVAGLYGQTMLRRAMRQTRKLAYYGVIRHLKTEVPVSPAVMLAGDGVEGCVARPTGFAPLGNHPRETSQTTRCMSNTRLCSALAM